MLQNFRQLVTFALAISPVLFCAPCRANSTLNINNQPHNTVTHSLQENPTNSNLVNRLKKSSTVSNNQLTKISQATTEENSSRPSAPQASENTRIPIFSRIFPAPSMRQ